MIAVISGVVYGEDRAVAAFVQSLIADMKRPFVNYAALGVVWNGRLVGGIVYHDFIGHGISVSGAFTTLRWWNAETVERLFAYPRDQLGCARVSAITATDNVKARRMIERLGFELEGVCRKGIDGVRDAAMYGLLFEQPCQRAKDNR